MTKVRRELEDGLSYAGEVRGLVFDGDLPPGTDLAALVDDPGHPLRKWLVSDSAIGNMVTNVGRQQMTKLIVGETASLIGYVGLTTSLTTPSLGAVALTDEIYRQAVSQRVSYLSYYQRYVAYFATTTFGSTGLAGEGLFDTASTGGSMWALTSITVSKTSAQSLVIVHLIQATS